MRKSRTAEKKQKSGTGGNLAGDVAILFRLVIKHRERGREDRSANIQ